MKDSDRTRTVVAGKYGLEKLLGKGGMGEVWVANELSTGRKLALKLLVAEGADAAETRARFEREARIASTLVSPHIVQVTDSGVDVDGQHFMAMELLAGEDLQKRIKAEKALPLAQVVPLAIQVGRALHVAHSAGLVHRDLKPANIFLARQGDEEVVKVLDFGIAKAAVAGATEFTAAGAMLGTAAYMSPEQIRNAKGVDHRADLWALSVVLFRSLTGQLPFEQTGFELFLALMEDPMPTPRKVTSLMPGLPAPLNVFFERSFLRDPAQRYPSASAAIVGFCRAAGVTVPPDILDASRPGAADPRSSMPVSAPLHTPPPASAPLSAPRVSTPVPTPPPGSAPISGPRSGLPTHTPPHGSAPVSGPRVNAPVPTPPPGSAPISGPRSGAPMHAPPSGPLGGLAKTTPISAEMQAALAAATPPASSAAPPSAAAQPVRPAAPGLDPDDPDNAATLFYQPGAKVTDAIEARLKGAPGAEGPPPVPPPPASAAPGTRDPSYGAAPQPVPQATPQPPPDAARVVISQAATPPQPAPAMDGSPQPRPAFDPRSLPTSLSMPRVAIPDQPRPRSRMWVWLVLVVVLLAGVTTAALLFLGKK